MLKVHDLNFRFTHGLAAKEFRCLNPWQRLFNGGVSPAFIGRAEAPVGIQHDQSDAHAFAVGAIFKFLQILLIA